MNQEMNRPSQASSMPVDLPYICRHLWKNIFVILMSACIVGIAAFVGLDMYMGSSYTASMNLSVIARDNSGTRLNDGSLNTAITRNLNVLNSDMLAEQICKDSQIERLPGTISASQVADTNMITLNATASSAEEALRLLKSALESYPTLTGYFESGYMFRNLTALSADNIQKQDARPLYYAALAALLVLAGGVGLTVFLCMSTDKVYNRQQAAMVLDIPVLNTIHYFRKKKNQKAILISDSATTGDYEEELDRLTTRVESEMNKNDQKVLMVTSIRENEGKSTITVNLALNLSRRGKKVMLIDCDMRRPAVAKIFDAEVEEGTGLSDLLAGDSTLKDVMRRDSRYKYLRCVFQNKAIAEPDKLLEDEAFKTLLCKIASRMDYVILDTPPLGIVRDAEIISAAADSVLLVIRQDLVHASEINDAVDVLDETGVTVLGGVLNMAFGDKNSVSRNKRYGKYYYGYGDKSK